MASLRFRRKYQTGGVIPNPQGYQVFSQPTQFQPNANPLVFDPNPVFGALTSRTNSLNSAISMGKAMTEERASAFEMHKSKIEMLEKQTQAIMDRDKAARDMITQLDLNSPEQRALADKLNKALNEATEQSSILITDPNMTPEAKTAAYMQQQQKVSQMFSDPTYKKYVENNAFSDIVLNNIIETTSSGESIINPDKLQSNLDIINKFKEGKINKATLLASLKPYTIDPENVTSEIDKMLDYIETSLDPKKAVTSYKLYAQSADYIAYHNIMRLPSQQEQVQALTEKFMSNSDLTIAALSTGDEKWVTDGNIDETKVYKYFDDIVTMMRANVGPDAGEFVIGTRSDRVGGSSSSSGNWNADEQSIVNELAKLGYQINDRTVFTIDGADSWSNWQEVLNSKDGKDLSYELQPLYKAIRGDERITPAIGEIGVGTTTQQGNTTNNINTSGTTSGDTQEMNLNISAPTSNTLTSTWDLPPGNVDNTVIPPEGIKTNLAYYTNNPLNIKIDPKVSTNASYVSEFDDENDGLRHQAFNTMQEGIEANFKKLYNWRDGKSNAFNDHLNKIGKKLEEATIEDLYTKWASGYSRDKIKQIADEAGYQPNTRLNEIEDMEDLFRGMLKVENVKLFNDWYGDGKKTKILNPSEETTTKNTTDDEANVNIVDKIDKLNKELTEVEKERGADSAKAKSLRKDIRNAKKEEQKFVDIVQAKNNVLDIINRRGKFNNTVNPHYKTNIEVIELKDGKYSVFNMDTDEEIIYKNKEELSEYLKTLDVVTVMPTPFYKPKDVNREEVRKLYDKMTKSQDAPVNTTPVKEEDDSKIPGFYK